MALPAVHALGREAEVLLRELRRRAVVAAEAGLRHRGQQQVGLARGVRPVAAQAAVVLPGRRVHGLLLQPLPDLLVAGDAERPRRGQQQVGGGARVGLVAPRAGVAGGRVEGPTGWRRDRDVVAAPAQGALLGLEQLRGLRRVGLVAGVAVARLEGLVLRPALGPLEHPVVAAGAQRPALGLQELRGPGVGLVAGGALALGHRGVEDGQARARAHVGVAGAAEVALGGGEQGLATRAVGCVAAAALVGGGSVDEGGPRLLRRILVAADAQGPAVGLQQVRAVGAVPLVAARALRGGRVRVAARERLAHVVVTADAERRLGADQHRGEVARVRVVAGQALPLGGRRVQASLAGLRLLVAVEAHAGAGGRRSRARRLLVAGPALEGGVHRGPEQVVAGRGVGRVARPAPRAGHREAPVTRREPVRPVVAGGAQGLPRLGEEGRLGRAVRPVAGEAARGHRGVDDLPREAAALVAARAELALGALQDLRVVGAVRVVAAGALLDLRVAVGRLEPERRGLVAAEAQLRLVGREPQRAHEAVGLVARRAVPLGHGGVLDLARLAHVGVALDAGAALLEARPPLQLAVGDAGAQAQGGERRRQADPRWSPHDRSHGSPRSPALSYGSGLGAAPCDGAAAAAGETSIRSAATRSS